MLELTRLMVGWTVGTGETVATLGGGAAAAVMEMEMEMGRR